MNVEPRELCDGWELGRCREELSDEVDHATEEFPALISSTWIND